MSVKITRPQHKQQVGHEAELPWWGSGRRPDYSQLITEDEEPVDNVFSELQQRLLSEPLYSNWKSERDFLAFANVGLFHQSRKYAVVPDVMLSMDVERPEGAVLDKHTRSYFIWEYGKPPEIVIEVVSNKKGNEVTRKVALYEQFDIPTYVVFDPMTQLSDALVVVYHADERTGEYTQTADLTFPDIGLALTLWDGIYQKMDATWLRWCTLDGILIPTGKEGGDSERQRADEEQQRADIEQRRADAGWELADSEWERAEAERKRADAERERADQLLAKLIAAGIDPNSL